MNKNVLVGLITLTCLIGGLIAAVAAWNRLENYMHVLRFVIIFVPLGFLTGLLVRSKLKKMIERDVPAELQKSYSQFGTVMGFIGFGLYFGTMLNSVLSDSITTREYIHEKRYSKASGPRSHSRYYVVVTANKKPELVQCSHAYWEKLAANDTITVIFHKSPMGFDFVELPDDN